jgi:hypothetical protein
MSAASDTKRAWLAVGCLSLAVAAAAGYAAETPPVAASPAAPAPAETPPADVGRLNWLDRPRDYLSEHIVNLSTRMDAFFGDERVFDESRKSFLRVYGDLTYSESRASDFNIRVQAKIILPALERRLHLLLESDDNPPGVIDQTNSIQTLKGVPNVDVPKGFRAALQMLVADSPQWNINTDGGIRIHGFRPDPFVRERVNHTQDMNLWEFRLTQSGYWFEQTGAGVALQFDADRRLQENRLFRSRSVATWSDHDQEYEYEQDFFVFQPLNVDNAMSYQLGVFGFSQPNTHISSYNIAVKWRHRLHREWLFTEIQPLLSWPEEQNFHPTVSILFRLEAVLGGVGCGCYGL